MALTSQQLKNESELIQNMNPVLRPLLASEKTGGAIGGLWQKYNIQTEDDQYILAETIFLYTIGAIDNQNFVSGIATISSATKNDLVLKNLLHDISQNLFGPYRSAFSQIGKDIDAIENIKPLLLSTEPESLIPPARPMPRPTARDAVATPASPSGSLGGQEAGGPMPTPTLPTPALPTQANAPIITASRPVSFVGEVKPFDQARGKPAATIPTAPQTVPLKTPAPTTPLPPPIAKPITSPKPTASPEAILEEEKAKMKPPARTPIISVPIAGEKKETPPAPKITYPAEKSAPVPGYVQIPKEEKIITRFGVEPRLPSETLSEAGGPESKSRLEISGSILSPGRPFGQPPAPKKEFQIPIKPVVPANLAPQSSSPSAPPSKPAPTSSANKITPVLATPATPPIKPVELKIPIAPAPSTPAAPDKPEPIVPPVISPEAPTNRPANPVIDLSAFQVKNKSFGKVPGNLSAPDALSEKHEPLPTPPAPKANGNILDLGNSNQ